MSSKFNPYKYAYKAKKIDSEEWVFGFYVFQKRRRGTFGQTITERDFERHYIITVSGDSYEINPMTLCSNEEEVRKTINFPYMVGDVVFAYNTCFNEILPYFIEQIIIDYDNDNKQKPYITFNANSHNENDDELLDYIDFDINDIGKTIFSTFEEAQRLLEE